MARARVQPEIIDNEDDSEPGPMDRKAAELAADLSQLGIVAENPLDSYEPPAELVARNDAFISVHRIDPNTKERIYCCQYAPAEFTLERLRLDKGGGYYWVKLLAPNPNNRGRPSVFWSAYPKLEGPPRTDNQPNPAGTQVALAGHDNATLVTTMQQGFAAMAQAIGEALRVQAPSMPVQSRKEMLEEMRLMRDMFQPVQSVPEPQHGGIAMLREMLTLAKELQPSDPDASPASILMNAADKLLPMLGAVLTAQAPQPGAVQTAQPTPAPSLIHTAPPEDDMNIRLQMGIKYLVSQAINDAPQETSAYMVLDNVPEADVQAFIIRPDWLEFLAAYDVRVRDNVHWFEVLRAEIRTILSEPGMPKENLTTENQASTTGTITGVATNS